MAVQFGRGRHTKQTEKLVPDYKDIELIKRYVVDSGRILPSRITGTSARFQRTLAKSVKLARYLALMPYCDAHRD